MFRLLAQRPCEAGSAAPMARVNADHPRTVWTPANIEAITAALEIVTRYDTRIGTVSNVGPRSGSGRSVTSVPLIEEHTLLSR
jgi:hypothetical protein